VCRYTRKGCVSNKPLCCARCAAALVTHGSIIHAITVHASLTAAYQHQEKFPSVNLSGNHLLQPPYTYSAFMAFICSSQDVTTTLICSRCHASEQHFGRAQTLERSEPRGLPILPSLNTLMVAPPHPHFPALLNVGDDSSSSGMGLKLQHWSARKKAIINQRTDQSKTGNAGASRLARSRSRVALGNERRAQAATSSKRTVTVIHSKQQHRKESWRCLHNQSG